MGRPATHGMSYSAEYRTWVGMIQRCHNPDDLNYKKYGARGIMVHPPWRDSFEAFFAHAGRRPSADHSLDRIDNGLGYIPGNVRWATRSEQQRNTRHNRMLTHGGRTQCLSAWAEEIGISKKTLHMRLSKGWSVARALTQKLEQQDHGG